MKAYLLFITTGIVLLTNTLFAQDSIKAKHYLFPDFTKAVIYYKEGSANRYLMNYNLIVDEMQFINDKDKKEAVFDFDKIEYIGVGLRRFVPLDNDFAEVITETDEVALVLKRFTRVGKQQGLGKITGGSRNKVNKILDKNESLPDDIILTPDSTYFLVRLVKPKGAQKGIFKGLSLSQNRVVDANHNGFLKVYSDKRDEINAFITNENIDLKKSDDIIRLVEFCNQ